MKRQTVEEFIKERRLLKMYKRKCLFCNSNLDPDEKCKCRLIKKLKELMLDGSRAKFELNQMDFENLLIKEITEQEVKVEDSNGRSWDIDMDSIVSVQRMVTL